MGSDTAADRRNSRATLREIADRAGVSVGAASYALNGKPGVSAETRSRIIAVANDLGWSPNPAARALSSSRANAIGFAMIRPAGTRGIDTYFVQLIGGLEEEATRLGLGLVLRMADDMTSLVSVVREWSAARTVDGIIMINLALNDPRIDLVRELSLPAVAIGGTREMTGVGTVSGDATETTERILSYLWSLGHRRIARVAGPVEFLHTRARDRALQDIAGNFPGLDAASVCHTDYSVSDGSRVTRDLLTRVEPPTAIVFDNDVMAAAALVVAAELHIRVPEDVSLVTWDDSDLCTIVRPEISAVVQEPTSQARQAVILLAGLIDGGPVQHVLLPAREFAVRGSSGPAPGASPRSLRGVPL